jgi:hypothetical protein
MLLTWRRVRRTAARAFRCPCIPARGKVNFTPRHDSLVLYPDTGFLHGTLSNSLLLLLLYVGVSRCRRYGIAEEEWGQRHKAELVSTPLRFLRLTKLWERIGHL